ncbi:ammonia channel protein, partial [Gammaproteobacteria bacterium]|nr:ammonia channel protein [Gammaproteobacteria bacterium]
SVAAYTGILTFIILKVVGAVTSGIRVTQEEEQMGLDITDHDERGYSL